MLLPSVPLFSAMLAVSTGGDPVRANQRSYFPMRPLPLQVRNIQYAGDHLPLECVSFLID